MSLRRCKGRDVVQLTRRELTPEGYLMSPAVIARTGIQEYTALELGLEASDQVLRLYRSPAEVFSQPALESFEAKPITLFHPENGVNASNWRGTAVGDFHNVRPAPGDAPTQLLSDLIVRDDEAVQAVAFGTQELSCGYDFDFDQTPGISPEGQPYDGLQRNIRGNHLAIVYRGRCGGECRVGDRAGAGDCSCTSTNPSRRTQMGALITRIIDGITLVFADDTQASVVERAVNDAKAKVTAAEERATVATKARDAAVAAELVSKEQAAAAAKIAADAQAKLVEDHGKAIAAKDAEIADLKAKQVTDAQIEARAAERSKLIADAKVLVADLKDEGKSLHQIRIEAITTVASKDEASKAIVVAVLDGVEVGNADEGKAKVAFATLFAARGKMAPASADDGGSEAERAAARVMAGADGAADDDAPMGRDLLMARMKNGGKDPRKGADADAEADAN